MKQKETSLNIDRIKQLRQIFDDYTDTDLGDDEMLALGRIGIGINLRESDKLLWTRGRKRSRDY